MTICRTGPLHPYRGSGLPPPRLFLTIGKIALIPVSCGGKASQSLIYCELGLWLFSPRGGGTQPRWLSPNFLKSNIATTLSQHTLYSCIYIFLKKVKKTCTLKIKCYTNLNHNFVTFF